MKLTNKFFTQGFCIFDYNFHTSVTPFKDLFALGVTSTETILESRRNFPVNPKNSKQWAKRKDTDGM